MTREEIKTKGLEMTTSLGLEDKKVILFWKAFEEGRLLACWLHLKSWELSLRKQWELFFAARLRLLCAAFQEHTFCPFFGTAAGQLEQVFGVP